MQSKKYAEVGATDTARNRGVIAAYLNIAAIIVGFVIACLSTGLILGLYAPGFCENNGW